MSYIVVNGVVVAVRSTEEAVELLRSYREEASS